MYILILRMYRDFKKGLKFDLGKYKQRLKIRIKCAKKFRLVKKVISLQIFVYPGKMAFVMCIGYLLS